MGPLYGKFPILFPYHSHKNTLGWRLLLYVDVAYDCMMGIVVSCVNLGWGMIVSSTCFFFAQKDYG